MEDKDIWEGLGVEPDEEETPVTQEPEDTKAEDETDIPGEEDDEEEIPEEEGDAGDGEEPDGQDLKAVHQQELVIRILCRGARQGAAHVSRADKCDLHLNISPFCPQTGCPPGSPRRHRTGSGGSSRW